MAVVLGRYVVTQSYTIPQGTLSTVTAGEPGTGGAAGYGNAATSAGYGTFASGQLIPPGTVMWLDSGTPSALYTALNGAGVLRAYVPGQDDVGHAALSN
jgi:hypothetical protein